MKNIKSKINLKKENDALILMHLYAFSLIIIYFLFFIFYYICMTKMIRCILIFVADFND